MATQAALPSDLTDDNIHYIHEFLNMYLNSMIFKMLMHGLYTGVLGVTLWNIFRSSTKSISIGRHIIVFTIIALYILATVSAGDTWASIHHAFINEGQNFYTIFLGLIEFSPRMVQYYWVLNITGGISTFIADSSLIWRCWIVWGCQWPVIIIPVLCTTLGTVLKGIEIYHSCSDNTNSVNTTYSATTAEWAISYMAMTVTTTLWCTIFILYHIISVVGSGHGMGIYSYRRIIQALVESAALYSAVLIIDIVFEACNILSGGYVDVLAVIIRGIAPTLLVGRVAAGHARPDDSWQESSTSTVSSLNFGTGTVSTQDGDVSQSAELDEMENLDPRLERNSALIEEVAQETRFLNIV